MTSRPIPRRIAALNAPLRESARTALRSWRSTSRPPFEVLWTSCLDSPRRRFGGARLHVRRPDDSGLLFWGIDSRPHLSELSHGRGMVMAERTVHFALDSLVADNYLTVLQPGHEKFYYVNEQLDSQSIRDEVVGILGLARWISVGSKSRSVSGSKSLKHKAGQR